MRVVELGEVARGALDLLGIRGKQGVRVEVGLGAHRQDVAVARIDGDRRAAARASTPLDRSLTWSAPAPPPWGPCTG